MATEEASREEAVEVKTQVIFKEGDIVKVVRKAEPHEMYKIFSWNSEKDGTIGKVGTVDFVADWLDPVMYLVTFDGKGAKYAYPTCVLEKTSKWKLRQIQKRIK